MLQTLRIETITNFIRLQIISNIFVVFFVNNFSVKEIETVCLIIFLILTFCFLNKILMVISTCLK